LHNKIECTLEQDWGRIYLYAEDDKKAIELLRHIFGIVSVSPVIETSSDLPTLSKVAVDYSKKLIKKGMSFAIRSRRIGTHEYTSQDAARKIGADVLDAFGLNNIKVNLTNPDVEIFIEVRNDKAFIFCEKISGPGGLPLGTQGRVVALLSNKYSLIAMWLLMKRGCKILPVYFENINTKNKFDPKKEIEKLRKWDPFINPRYLSDNGIVVSDNFELQGHTNSEYARVETIAKKFRAGAIVTGETYNQLNNKNELIDTSITIPIFYPLIGLDENMIRELEIKVL
jgi:thiamine biosynthesis protein ThiI